MIYDISTVLQSSHGRYFNGHWLPHTYCRIIYKKGRLNFVTKMFTCKKTNQSEGQILMGRNCRKKNTTQIHKQHLMINKMIGQDKFHKNRKSDISCFEGIASRIPHMTPILYNDNTNISYYLGNDHLTWKRGGELWFFLKKIFWFWWRKNKFRVFVI